jgi:CheY-like chemotaxis protein
VSERAALHDGTVIRRGFRMILEEQAEITVIGEAADGDEAAVRLTRELHPDVVLMDVRMPGADGIDATRHIVAESPEARVLVLTTYDLDEYAFSALRYGASRFLLKDARPADLAGRHPGCGQRRRRRRPERHPPAPGRLRRLASRPEGSISAAAIATVVVCRRRGACGRCDDRDGPSAPAAFRSWSGL